MKSKDLNILRRTKKVLPYILISGLILEVIILALPIKTIARIPNFLDIYNYALAVISLLLLLGLIFLPEKKKNAVSSINSKESYAEREIKGMRRFVIRSLSFSLLGFICGVLFNLSYTVESGFFLRLDSWFRIGSLLFILVYPILWFLFTYKKGISGFPQFLFDTLLYAVCGFVGFVITAVLEGVILLVKGFIWLIQYPQPIVIFGIIVFLMFLLTYLPYKDSNK
ncbi:MAG: hypothetical protein NTZ83_03855 [Candidatus Pacearchaeota archaeon]|nr:hypothetical protein [Candidatus Pacearchaeota archaeon]